MAAIGGRSGRGRRLRRTILSIATAIVLASASAIAVGLRVGMAVGRGRERRRRFGRGTIRRRLGNGTRERTRRSRERGAAVGLRNGAIARRRRRSRGTRGTRARRGRGGTTAHGRRGRRGRSRGASGRRISECGRRSLGWRRTITTTRGRRSGRLARGRLRSSSRDRSGDDHRSLSRAGWRRRSLRTDCVRRGMEDRFFRRSLRRRSSTFEGTSARA